MGEKVVTRLINGGRKTKVGAVPAPPTNFIWVSMEEYKLEFSFDISIIYALEIDEWIANRIPDRAWAYVNDNPGSNDAITFKNKNDAYWFWLRWV